MSGTSLVIGGTGMLATATRFVATISDRTVLVSRRAAAFAQQEGGNYVPVNLDWHSPQFPRRLEENLSGWGVVARALLWLHQPERALPWLLPLLRHSPVVLVLGGVHRAAVLETLPANVATVRLGRMTTRDGERWLTHEEISAGAIAAIRSGRSIAIGECPDLR